MKQKVLFLIAALFGIISAMAQGNIYVATKGGVAYTFPIETLDSIAFAIPQGARIIDPQQTIDSLNAEIAKCGGSETYEYVDLGLPSGTLWATHNIGAIKPEEYGNYYAWGETETKETYTEKNSRWFGVEYDSLKSKGVIDSLGNLTPQYDAATVYWGDDWRMPTYEEIEELLTLDNEVTKLNGIKGIKFIGKNGKYLFLPFAGYHREDEFDEAGKTGNYWLSTVIVNDWYKYYLHLDSYEVGGNYSSRANGFTIRPVKKSK